jgi:chromate transporter
MNEPSREGSPLRQLAWLFLRLGTTAFGGPAAHIAMMEDEVVRRRAWLSREEFLDLLGATNLIPGPNSTEMAIHIGYRRAGWPGLIVAGSCFIVPAMLMVLAIAVIYVRYGKLPQVQAVLYGVKPVIIAIVLQALWGLGRSAVKTWFLLALAVGATAASFMGVNELLILLAGGLLTIGYLLLHARSRDGGMPAIAPLLPKGILTHLAVPALATGAAAVAFPFSIWILFLFFLKIGAVLYGSGYVLLAFLQAGLVQRYGWMTQGQLLDAVVVGQITPGPVFTTATFIGYLLGGVKGALAATLGIFLPAFLGVAISGPLVPRIRRSRVAGAFLDGVNVSSLALMAAVTWELGRSAIVDAPTVVLAVAAAFLLVRYRVNSLWLILAGAALGVVL